MSDPAEDDWVLNEAEALLDTDGRRERLEQVIADLQSGKIHPVGHAAARDRVETRIAEHMPVAARDALEAMERTTTAAR